MKIEKLENRVLLSVQLDIHSGVLSIDARAVGDVVAVSRTSNVITVVEAGIKSQFSAAQMQAISASLGAGADKLSISSTVAVPATVVGGSGNDTIVGGGGNDFFSAGSGNDSLMGGSANSTLAGGGGIDTLVGNGTGTDYLFEPQESPAEYILNQAHVGGAYLDFRGLTFGDSVIANLQTDFLGSYDAVTIVDAKAGECANYSGIYDGPGDDNLIGNNRGDLIVGGNGTDTITGGTSADRITLGSGHDTVSGEGGADRITGTDGNYVIYETNSTTDPLRNGGSVPTEPKPVKSIQGAYIYGGTGTASIIGGLGNDTLQGDGSDTIYGLGYGDDYISGGSGTCLLTGNSGNDMIFAGDGPTAIYGGAGSDELVSGPAGDLLVGEGGNNTLYGSTGNDTLYGGDAPGQNTIPANAVYHNLLIGGSGNTVMYAGNGGDVLQGGNGNNTLIGGVGNDTISSGTGTSFMDGGGGINTVTFASYTVGVIISPDGTDDSGMPGQDDTIMPNFQILIGGSGDDFIFAGNYNSTLIGSAGDDFLVVGTAGNDVLIGNAGNNTLYGGSGSDTLYGGDGPGPATFSRPDTYSNQLYGLTGNNLLIAGAGGDYLDGGSGDSTLFGGIGNDTLIGESGNDLTLGGAGDDSIDGGSGNDTIYGGPGADTITGGSGADSINASDPTSSQISPALYQILLSQSAGANINQDSGDSIYGGSGNETITGGPGDDTIVGGNGNDLLNAGSGNAAIYGGFGDDTLNGGAGIDTLDGGPGNCTLLGGTGDDIFVNADANTANVVGGSGYNIAQQTLPGRDTFTNIQYFYDLIPGQPNPNTPAAVAASSLSSMNIKQPLAAPAVTPAATVSHGVLTVTGTAKSDIIYVYQSATTVSASINGVVSSYPLSSVNSVVVNTGAGNNFVQCLLAGYVDPLMLPATINGGSGGDTLVGGDSVESLNGGGGDDLLISNCRSNTLNGGAGNDLLIDADAFSTAGNVFIGGGGIDTVGFPNITANLILNLNGTPTSGAAGEGDTISTDISNVLDGQGSNIIVGDTHSNFISGGDGYNTVYGGAGHDFIEEAGQGNLGHNIIYPQGRGNFINLINNATDYYAKNPTDYLVADASDVQIPDQSYPWATIPATPSQSAVSSDADMNGSSVASDSAADIKHAGLFSTKVLGGVIQLIENP